MHREDEHVQCPYYKEDTQQSVQCEGVEDGCGLRLGFATRQQLKEYKARYCRKDWKKCMVAAMLNKKYDYDC